MGIAETSSTTGLNGGAGLRAGSRITAHTLLRTDLRTDPRTGTCIDPAIDPHIDSRVRTRIGTSADTRTDSHTRGPRAATRPRGRGEEPRVADSVTDIVRWGAFSSALVLVVLLMCGSSLEGAFGTSFGLVAVTAACRVLLRRSERVHARLAAEQPGPHRGRHGRTGTGTHRGGHRQAPM